MLAALFFAASSLALGWSACRRFFSGLELAAVSVVVSFIAGAWLAFLTSGVMGGLSQTSVVVASVVALVVSFFLARPLPKLRPGFFSIRRNDVAADLPVLALASLAFVLFTLLFWSHAFEPKADGWYSGGSSWGDYAVHASLANSFSHGSLSRFSADGTGLEFPFFPGARLTYPFMADFHAAVLMAGGFSLRGAFMLTGVALAVSLCVLLYFFALRLSGRRGAAALAVALVFLSGGLGFVGFLKGAAAPGVDPVGFFLKQPHDYSHYVEGGFQWSNFVVDLMLPQRAFLYALPLVIALLSLLWESGSAGRPGQRLFIGVFGAALFLFQPHAVLAIGVVAGVFALLSLAGLAGGRRAWREGLIGWSWLFVPLVLLSLPQLLWVSPAVKGSFVRPFLGWYGGKEAAGWLWFWLKNAGVVFALAFPAWLLRKDAKARAFYVGFAALFAIGNLVALSPHEYDNIKLLYVWFAATAALVAGLVVSLLWQGRLRRVAFFAVAAVAVASGFLSVSRELTLSWSIYDNNDIALAQWVDANTPRDAVFLTSDRHNQPVYNLAGRTVLMGYRGWLWTYGIDYSQRESDVRTMLSGAAGADGLLKRYGVGYAVVGAYERSYYAANDAFFSKYPVAYQAGGYSVYRIK